MVKERFLKEELEILREDFADLEMYVNELSVFLPLAFCTIAPSQIIININRAFEELTGYQTIEIVGKPISHLFLEKKEVKEILNEVQEKGTLKKKELTLLSRDKREIPVSIAIASRKDKEGNFLGYFLSLEDIGEIKKYREHLEEEVKKRTKELQEKLEELERFHQLTVGRELKMIELKESLQRAQKEIEKLKEAKKDDHSRGDKKNKKS